MQNLQVVATCLVQPLMWVTKCITTLSHVNAALFLMMTKCMLVLTWDDDAGEGVIEDDGTLDDQPWALKADALSDWIELLTIKRNLLFNE